MPQLSFVPLSYSLIKFPMIIPVYLPWFSAAAIRALYVKIFRVLKKNFLLLMAFAFHRQTVVQVTIFTKMFEEGDPSFFATPTSHECVRISYHYEGYTSSG